jgi:hypothetical protein
MIAVKNTASKMGMPDTTTQTPITAIGIGIFREYPKFGVTG